MQLQTYKGYFERGRFFTTETAIQEIGRYQATLILEEPITINRNTNTLKDLFNEETMTEIEQEELELRSKWLKKLHDAIDLSLDEELPDIIRSSPMRKPINLTD